MRLSLKHIAISGILIGLWVGLALIYTFSATGDDALPGRIIAPYPDRLEVTWTLTEAELATLIEQTKSDEKPALSFLAAVPPAAAPTLIIHSSPLPVEGLTWETVGNMDGIELVRVTFYPLALPEVDRTEPIRFTLAFNSAFLPQPPAAANRPLSPIQNSVQSLVVNPDFVTARPAVLANRIAADAQAAESTSTSIATLTVSDVGITEINSQLFNEIGFPAALTDPNKIFLTHQGGEIPLIWEGDSDPFFETGERFLFYAEPEFSRWTNEQAYVLKTWTSDTPRMSTQVAATTARPSSPLTLSTTFEENQLYTPNCYCGILPGGRDGDRWVWKEMRRPGTPSTSVDFSLSGIDFGQPAEMTLWMIGFTDLPNLTTDHQVALDLNGTSLGTVSWGGKSGITQTVTIPAGILTASNTFSLSLQDPGSISLDGVWLDAFEIKVARPNITLPAGEQLIFEGDSDVLSQYSLTLANPTGLRLFDVTSLYSPILQTSPALSGSQLTIRDQTFTGRRYAAATDSSIHSPASVRLVHSLQTESTSGARYLIITPKQFEATLNPLINHRESQGYTVEVEWLEAIYDHFADSEPTPEAVQAFIQDAYQNWATRPEMVLLIGDGHVDPKGYVTDSANHFFPPFLVDADPQAGEVAADNRFVTVNGDDILPDLAVGRLPIRSTTELSTVIDKLIRYDSVDRDGFWRAKAIFSADNPDTAGDFAAHSSSLQTTHFQTDWLTPNLFLQTDQLGSVLGDSLISAWNAGAGLVVFNGHSSIHQLAAERIFHLDDVNTLQNGDKLPIVLQMTCFTGAFHTAQYDTLDEALLRHPNGGAVAVWGATGLGVASGHDALADGFLDQLLSSDGTLGPATVQGKLLLMTHQPQNADLVDTFNLLGDPATRFVTTPPEYNSIYLPVHPHN